MQVSALRHACVYTFLACALCSATAQAQPEQSSHVPDPPGTVDGAKQPELIPDDCAYRLVIRTLAEPSHPSDFQRARQAARLKYVMLSDNDRAVLIKTLSGVGDRRAGQSATDLDKAADSARSTLQSALTADGWQHFVNYVQAQKRFMKSLPPPPM